MASQIAIALDKWQSLLQQFAVNPTGSQKVFFKLIIAYASPGRFYHNLSHVLQVLEVIEKMRSHSQNFAALQFAAWFHDIIYNPKAKNNEQRSAKYAADVLTHLYIPAATIDSTIQLILITQNHQAQTNEIDRQIFLDADLSILGASQPIYQNYAIAIRQEYTWLSPSEYCLGRMQVLTKFLQRERIYHTQQMFTELEIKARQNMQEEIQFLSAVNDNK